MKRKQENKKHAMPKVLAAVLAAVMVSSLGLMGISAYFTAEDTAENIFTVGNISLELQEPGWEEANGAYVLPGQEVRKDPQIVNDGHNDEFVFLEVVIPYATIQTANEDGSWNASSDVELFAYDWNTEDWVQIGEGAKDPETKTVSYVYAYAKEGAMTALTKDSTTSALFEYVRFANVADAAQLDASSMMVEINAYGIQTTNLNDGDLTIDGNNDDGKTAPADVWAMISAKGSNAQ